MRKRVAGLMLGGALLASTAPHAQQTLPSAPQDMAKLNAEIRAAVETCIECHGPGGVSSTPTRPTIAGQKAVYIQSQLEAFKSSANGSVIVNENLEDPLLRSDPVMEHMAQGLPDYLIEPLSVAMSAMACDGGDAKPKSKFKPRRPFAADACVSCHGVDGIGVWDGVPNLAGQQRAYLRRQLLLIRETAWGAEPREGESWRSHPIMEAKTARMRIADIDAIARYYSKLDCRGAVASTPEENN
ncbi:c-type cytochrome [Magnetovibrio sp. PR-2]|uniref:c-type cytochrome n=1 Tax=Magnetovibrio sp. PR-2 TaxID=3120356 RepID=UPI002FCE3B92